MENTLVVNNFKEIKEILAANLHSESTSFTEGVMNKSIYNFGESFNVKELSFNAMKDCVMTNYHTNSDSWNNADINTYKVFAYLLTLLPEQHPYDIIIFNLLDYVVESLDSKCGGILTENQNIKYIGTYGGNDGEVTTYVHLPTKVFNYGEQKSTIIQEFPKTRLNNLGRLKGKLIELTLELFLRENLRRLEIEEQPLDVSEKEVEKIVDKVLERYDVETIIDSYIPLSHYLENQGQNTCSCYSFDFSYRMSDVSLLAKYIPNIHRLRESLFEIYSEELLDYKINASLDRPDFEEKLDFFYNHCTYNPVMKKEDILKVLSKTTDGLSIITVETKDLEYFEKNLANELYSDAQFLDCIKSESSAVYFRFEDRILEEEDESDYDEDYDEDEDY